MGTSESKRDYGIRHNILVIVTGSTLGLFQADVCDKDIGLYVFLDQRQDTTHAPALGRARSCLWFRGPKEVGKSPRA